MQTLTKKQKKEAKQNIDELFEMFFNFCGDMEKLLRSDYKKSKSKERGITYPQFCIVMFSNFMQQANELLNFKTK